MKLLEFVKHKMRMSHVYQPVMIKALLENDGKLSVEDIAKEILSYDISQIEYYENVTKNMVGRVLSNHKIVSRNKDSYELVDYNLISEEDKVSILVECENKIQEYIINVFMI